MGTSLYEGTLEGPPGILRGVGGENDVAPADDHERKWLTSQTKLRVFVVMSIACLAVRLILPGPWDWYHNLGSVVVLVMLVGGNISTTGKDGVPSKFFDKIQSDEYLWFYPVGLCFVLLTANLNSPTHADASLQQSQPIARQSVTDLEQRYCPALVAEMLTAFTKGEDKIEESVAKSLIACADSVRSDPVVQADLLADAALAYSAAITEGKRHTKVDNLRYYAAVVTLNTRIQASAAPTEVKARAAMALAAATGGLGKSDRQTGEAQPAYQSAPPPPENVQPAKSPQEEAVRAFYKAINEKRYAEAYDMLSPRFREGTSLAAFTNGYATTRDIEVTTDTTSQKQVIQADLMAHDIGVDGTLKSTLYFGTWKLVSERSGFGSRWLLDEGRFSK